MDPSIVTKESPSETKPVERKAQNIQPEVHVTGELITSTEEPAPSHLEDKGATAESVTPGDDEDYDGESDYDNEHELIYSDDEDESYVIEPSVHKGNATQENTSVKSENDVQPDTLDQCVEITEQTLKMVQELEGSTCEEENVKLYSNQQSDAILNQPVQDKESDVKEINKAEVSPGNMQASHDTNDSAKSLQNNESVSNVNMPSEKMEQGVEVSQRTLKLVHEVSPDGKIEKRIRVSESDEVSKQNIQEKDDTNVGDPEAVEEKLVQEATSGVQLESPVFGKDFKPNSMERSVSNQIESEIITKADNIIEKEAQVQKLECLPDETGQDLNIGQPEEKHVLEDTLVSSTQPETADDSFMVPRVTEIKAETQRNVTEEPENIQSSESQKEPDPQETPTSQPAVEEGVSLQFEDEKQLNADEDGTDTEHGTEVETKFMTQHEKEHANQGTETQKEEAGPKKLPLHVRQGYLDEKARKEKEQMKSFDFSVLIFVGAAIVAIIAVVWMIAYSLGINS